MSDEAFASYGWRIPFFASVLLVGLGLYVRLKVEETPVFKAQVATTGVVKIPLIEAFRRQPREILIAAGVGLTPFCFFYVSGSYLSSFATGTLHLSRTVVLIAGTIGGVVLATAAVVSAISSDRFGRRRLIGFAAIAGCVWSLALVPVLQVATPSVYILAICVTMIITGVAFGPMGAFLPELFETRYRFTASAVSYNIGTVIGGSVTPLLATTLTTNLGAYAFGLLLAVMCLLGAVATFSLRETRDEDLDDMTVGSRPRA
jgi:MFS family permease